MLIQLKGTASGSITELPIRLDDRAKTVLEFLLEANIPIAYSCRGQQKCKKCNINGDLLSCSLTVEQLLNQSNTIEVSYL